MRLCAVCIALFAGPWFPPVARAAEEPIDAQTNRQLFIDDHGIDQVHPIKRVVNQPAGGKIARRT